MYKDALKIKEAITESQLLRHMESLSQKNQARKSFIGMGYEGKY